MQELICPICKRQLGKNEGLVVTHDLRGRLIVWHIIPETTPYRHNETDDEFYKNIADAGPLDLFNNPVRHCCGQAGFRKAEFS